jgi:hypothetical protein
MKSAKRSNAENGYPKCDVYKEAIGQRVHLVVKECKQEHDATPYSDGEKPWRKDITEI